MKRFYLTFAVLAIAITAVMVLSACGDVAWAKTIKIAFIGPLTGPNAAQGNGAKNSFDLAIKQANDGHERKHWSRIHAGVLAVGAGVGIWLYTDGIIGQTWIQRIVELP